MKPSLKAVFKRTFTPLGFKTVMVAVIALTVLVLLLVPSVKQIWDRLSSELNPAYVWDDPMYWAIGRGILNGLTPYVDLFETKPPGIYWMSALTLKLTGGVYAMNVFSFFCLLITGFIPSIGTAILCRKRNCSRRTSALILFTSLLFGMMLALYAQSRSGYIQIEAFGSMFVCLYLLLIFDADNQKLKFWSPSVIASGLLLACAGLLKEPFVPVAVGVSLLFAGDLRGVLYKTVFPLLYGGAAGTAAMGATGVLKPYLTVYLKRILDDQVCLSESPFQKTRDYVHIINDLSTFSPLLLCAVIFLFVFVFIYLVQDVRELRSSGVKHWLRWTGRFIILPVGLLAASLAVAIGNQYYNHHFVFALPAYMALMLFILKGCIDEPNFLIRNHDSEDKPEIHLGPKQCRRALSILCVILLFGFYLLPDFTYDQRLSEETTLMKTHAVYIDKLLDEKGIDRYLFLGFNGPYFYGLTEHSPLGPVFVQSPDYFAKKDTWFTKSLFAELDEAQIVFVANVSAGVITDEVWDILNTDFIRDDAHSVSKDGNPVDGLPDGFTYITYVRKSA
ncbi:MAG TPA: hypothetical protein PK854_10360 [Oscillospiraceae bacterium]|nr:hypothetical protein [Oscillospiraceae bacterium]HPS35656.1 hypothetical protein [Oscillospiraceae bacterium]